MKPTPGRVRITVLGSGDAFGSGGRLQSSYLIEGERTAFLMDCGASVLSALKRAGCDTGDIDFILVSHLHGDHFGGLPFLLLEYLYENRRERPLIIAGPEGLAERTRAVYAALYREAAATPHPFDVEFRVLEPDRPVTLGDVEVHPFRVPHQTTCVSLGMRVSVDGRRILYSGDSAWSEEFVRRSADTDLFLCECFLFDTRVEYHVNYRELARNAQRLGCKRLVLSHLGREFLARESQVTHERADDGAVIEI
jgi:ribonuclease BN (tRNA processing enzyme)